MKVARRHPLINETPAPDVVFESFGDSTLNFELRVFIPNREVYAKVLHELNMSINAAFAEKDIEIAFPQQDIHIKNLNELPGGGGDPRGRSPHGGSSSGGPGEAPLNEFDGPGSEMPSAVNQSHQSPHQSQVAAVTGPNAKSSPVPTNLDSIAKDSSESQAQRRVIPFPLRQIRGAKDGVIGKGIRKAS